MLTEYLFVSCDIVAHSAEPQVEVQVARVEGINRAIGALLQQHEDEKLVWASGGDGGHVAIPFSQRAPGIALDLILTLRRWSIAEAVPLRVCGSFGAAREVRGADGRAQLAGPGINMAGRLLPYGGERRVVVMDTFRDVVKRATGDAFNFHDCVRLEPKNSPPLIAWLLSNDDHFESTWRQPESTTDAALLAGAVLSSEALEVIYRARRLLELNSSDGRAIQALRSLGDMTFKGRRNFLHKLIQDEHIGAELIRFGNLVERRAGETVCSSGDEGTSMFLVLRGRLQVFFGSDMTPESAMRRQESVVMAPGDLGGELAFALRRNRTATLQCIEDAALLSFTYEELLQSFASSPDGVGVRRALATEILAKVLENFCNTAPFFRPVWGVLSEPSKLAPWSALLPHSELVTISADRLWIDFPLSPPTEEVVLLVSGRLRAEGSTEKWTGEGYPLIYAHLGSRASASSTRLSLREDCQVLRIKREGLLRLGADAFELICDQASPAMESVRNSEKIQTRLPARATTSTDLVFISYCRDNHSEVAFLRDRLIEAGEQVWWDQDLLPGSDWKIEIRHAMRRSYAIICCLSAELANRSQSGVYPEIADAVRAVRERRPGEIFLVPVRLSECDIPQVEIDDGRTLDRLQTLDLFPQNEFAVRFERLVAALRKARR